MLDFDPQPFLLPISESDPCGPDLANDPQRGELVQLMREPGAATTDGADLDAAERENDSAFWNRVLKLADGVLKKSRDIWVAAYLTFALLKLNEVDGLAVGLELLRGLVEKFPDGLHPKPELDDPYPIDRLNALAFIASARARKALNAATLCQSKQYGKFTFLDLLVADGKIAPTTANPSKGDLNDVNRALADFKANDAEAFEARAGAIGRASGHAKVLRAYITEKSGPEHRDDLEELDTKLQLALNCTTASQAAAPPAATPETPASGPAAPGPRITAPPPVVDGEIRSREDVARTLTRILAYYEKCEPSSPVPLLLARAGRMIRMSYIDTIRELLPDRVAEMETVAGVVKPKQD
jgi:type VI secretion system protein ImpA